MTGADWYVPTGLSVGTLRALALFVPVGLTAAVWALRRPTGRRAAAVWIAGLWLLASLQIANEVAIAAGWWHFEADGGVFRGVPFDVLLGWCLAWGPLLFLVTTELPVVVLAAAAVILDIGLMPRLAPLVVLGDDWLIGELIVVLFAFVPAHLLARWTQSDRHLRARATLQIAGFALINLWILPSAAVAGARSLGGASALVKGADLRFLASIHSQRVPSSQASEPPSILVQSTLPPEVGIADLLTPATLSGAGLIVVGCLVGVWAVREFVVEGGGTPIPWDPPRRLVVTGPYAWVANPMQISALLILLGQSLALRLPMLAFATLVVFAYCAGLAAWHEGEAMRARFGDGWVAYRRHVRDWIPRRP